MTKAELGRDGRRWADIGSGRKRWESWGGVVMCWARGETVRSD